METALGVGDPANCTRPEFGSGFSEVLAGVVFRNTSVDTN